MQRLKYLEKIYAKKNYCVSEIQTELLMCFNSLNLSTLDTGQETFCMRTGQGQEWTGNTEKPEWVPNSLSAW